jgi:hypothetical protein
MKFSINGLWSLLLSKIIAVMKKIDPLRLAFDTYAFVCEELSEFFRLVWMWFAIHFATTMAVHFSQYKFLEGPGLFIMMVVTLASASGFAFSWHRFVIVGDASRDVESNYIKNLLRYGTTWITLWSPFIILFIVHKWILSVVPESEQRIQTSGYENLSLIMFILLTPLIVRSCLRLPALSIDDGTLSFRKSWNFTRQNTFRFLFSTFLISLPLILGIELIKLSIPYMAQLPFALIISFSSLGLWWFFVVAIYSGHLSFVYKELVLPYQNQ